MNQQASPAPDDAVPPRPRPAPVVEDAAAALRLPGPLGRPREELPIAPLAPLIPTALSEFNRLTGRLDEGGPGAPAEDETGGVVAELGGTPGEPPRAGSRRRRRRQPAG
jgi:hypothetical protein